MVKASNLLVLSKYHNDTLHKNFISLIPAAKTRTMAQMPYRENPNEPSFTGYRVKISPESPRPLI
jgi:hypothetical protein